MVPLGSVIKVAHSFGPDGRAARQPYRSADINCGPRAGVSALGRAGRYVERSSTRHCPAACRNEWTDLSYQQLISVNTAILCSRCFVLFLSWCSPRSTRASPCRWRRSHRA